MPGSIRARELGSKSGSKSAAVVWHISLFDTVGIGRVSGHQQAARVPFGCRSAAILSANA
jgi:hypothetical protein